MSGKTPFFLTGGNARILLNNKTVAYATNITYKVSVKNASPRVLGRFEVEVIQPLAYDVTGTLQIIKYGRGLQSYFGSSSPDSVDNKGNGIGSYGLSALGGALGSALGLPSADGQFDGAPNESFDPSRFFQSKMFNIEIRQKIPNKSLVSPGAEFIKNAVKNIPGGKQLGEAVDFIRDPNDKLIRDTSNHPSDEAPMIMIRDCRFEDLSFELNKRGVATINLTFRARYVDDDSAIARKSGVGQELS